MAVTNKGSKWETQNSLFLIMSFIPFLNVFCFMHMNDRVKNKTWKNLMWITVFVSVITMTIGVTFANYANQEVANVPERDGPTQNDYMTQDFIDSYEKNGKYSEFRETKEYKEYSAALDKYDEEYENRPDVKSAKAANEKFSKQMNLGKNICFAIFALYNLFIFVYLLTQRVRFLQMYSAKLDEELLQSRLANQI